MKLGDRKQHEDHLLVLAAAVTVGWAVGRRRPVEAARPPPAGDSAQVGPGA